MQTPGLSDPCYPWCVHLRWRGSLAWIFIVWAVILVENTNKIQRFSGLFSYQRYQHGSWYQQRQRLHPWNTQGQCHPMHPSQMLLHESKPRRANHSFLSPPAHSLFSFKVSKVACTFYLTILYCSKVTLEEWATFYLWSMDIEVETVLWRKVHGLLYTWQQLQTRRIIRLTSVPLNCWIPNIDMYWAQTDPCLLPSRMPSHGFAGFGLYRNWETNIRCTSLNKAEWDFRLQRIAALPRVVPHKGFRAMSNNLSRPWTLKWCLGCSLQFLLSQSTQLLACPILHTKMQGLEQQWKTLGFFSFQCLTTTALWLLALHSENASLLLDW